MPVIGVIGAGERGGFADLLVATRLGLKDIGFVEGQNFEFEYAFAAGRFEELPKLASDLVRRPVAVIISTGVGSGLAAKGARRSGQVGICCKLEQTSRVPPQTASVQLSENANADVEKGRPSRSRGQDCPLPSMPLRTRRVPSAGINTVHTP